jgi:signal transduction histidine kinase
MAAGAWERLFPLWDGVFAVVAVTVAIAAATDDTTSWPLRLMSIGAIALGALLYLVWGRVTVEGRRSSRRASRQTVAFIGAELALFLVAELGSENMGFLLFALTPLIMLALPIRAAIPAIIVANLIPVGAVLVSEGFSAPVLTHLGPITVISIAFAILLGSWISRIIQQSRERADLIAELETSRAEIGRLSHEAGVAAERARLAGEIHDTLAQGFTSIITLLQAADPELADERLALAVRTARENLAESRALIAALTPSALGSGSLLDAVRRQVSRFTEESGIPATCRTTGDPRTLPTAVEVVLLRAAQESLANIRRHAGAREAAVLLAYAEATVRLVVRDDGGGFDPATAGGFGLRGMRARAEQVAGALTVHSDPDIGTTIEVEVPA